MLEITIAGNELFDERNNKFIAASQTVLRLEHSLVTLSKWEQKYQKPFLSQSEKSNEELFYYVWLMVQGEKPPMDLLRALSSEHVNSIKEYLESPESATRLRERKVRKTVQGETVTAEIIYYWMIAFNVPVEFQYWNLNRLLTLIRLCEAKTSGVNDKRTPAEIAAERREINERQKTQFGTRG